MIILLLLFSYNKDKKGNSQWMTGVVLVVACILLFGVSMTEMIPSFVLDRLYDSNILIILGSRLPQIHAIYKAGSTGNNAFFTWFLNFGGAVARMFTIFKEVEDFKPLLMIGISVICNGSIVVQFLIYWNSDKKKKKE